MISWCRPLSARRLVDAFNIPVIEIPGFEADDVVGTLAKHSCAEGYEALIVTGDLYTLQLVNHCVKVMATIRGVTHTVIYDEQAVEDRYEMTPAQMIDYKGAQR